jgi:Flp pilus assembly protein TadD
MAHDVFVSYASGDKTVADAVCATLESSGVRCWIAPRDVEPGLAYGEAIVEAIQSCRIMVLVFSSRANASAHIPKEIERAVSTGSVVIPLRIEDVKPAKSLDYFIGNVHWLDALNPPIAIHLRRLAKNVKTLLSRGDPATERTDVFSPAEGGPLWGARGAAADPNAPVRREDAPAHKQAKRPITLYVLLGTLTILVVVFAYLNFVRKPHENPAAPPAAATNPSPPPSTVKPRSGSSGAGRQKSPPAQQMPATNRAPSTPQMSPAVQAPPASQSAPAATPPATTTPSAAKGPPPTATPPSTTKSPSKDDSKSADTDELAQQEESQGEALAAIGDYAGAIAKYREIIRQHPNNAVAHGNLSNALRLKGDIDGAVAEADEAIRIKPHLVIGHNSLGLALAKKGDLDGAIAQFRETISINFDLPNAHQLLGLTLARKKDWDGAIAEYRQAVRLKPDFADAHFFLAKALTAKGDKAGAAREYSEAHRLDPKFSLP